MSHKLLPLYFIFILLLRVMPTCGQYASGTIVNQQKQPLEGASIYFDGTDVGVISNKQGEFKIPIPKIEKLLLVIDYLGFEKRYIEDVDSNNTTYVLIPKEDDLDEIFIDHSHFSREELLEVFKREFLGETSAGKKCVITNEDAIRIRFDINSNTISAYTTEDLVIHNPKLNYQIRFNLLDFEVQLSAKNLRKDFVKQSYFYGTSFFENLEPLKKKHQQRRKKSYLGSVQHFFKSLYLAEIEENNFIVAKNGFRVSAEQVFKTQQIDDLMILSLGPSDANKNANLFKQIGRKVPYFFTISVLYKKNKQSDIKFTTPHISIDPFGNHSPVEEVYLTGEMAKAKLGGMLPSNYTY